MWIKICNSNFREASLDFRCLPNSADTPLSEFERWIYPIFVVSNYLKIEILLSMDSAK